MNLLKRTVTCGELTKANAGSSVVLNGWVHRNRDHGGIHFIDLRDRYGITQIVVDPETEPGLEKSASELKFEYCIAVAGVVQTRPDSMVNAEMTTGEIEVHAKSIQILSRSEVLPFMIDGETEAREDLRLEYRYLDLRSKNMQNRIALRHRVAFAVREYLNKQGFLEIETPTLIRSTPEGARDFLVPSRLHAGKFYALPQSPQLFKQILMVSGFDRYFQLARCYRDEDARGDRQPEHTQIDIEMSFVSQEDVFAVAEGMLAQTLEQVVGAKVHTPFQQISYKDAMEIYGSDKPDLRFELKLRDFSAFAISSDFRVFKEVAAGGGSVRALIVPQGASFSRKTIDELESAAKIYGAKGLAWMRVTEEGLDGGIARFFLSASKEIKKQLNAAAGDLILAVADEWEVCCTSLGAVRSKLGADLKLAADTYAFCRITDFPLFSWNADENRWEPAHHMFTMPQEEYLEDMESHPGDVKGELYDLVCNGYEIASGSIRIHQPELQQRVFSILGISKEEAEHRFGFLMKAFGYGPPPHGGIALGLDRLVMILTGEQSIKEVIAFPKNTVGISPMDGSPSSVDPQQLADLHIDMRKPEIP